MHPVIHLLAICAAVVGFWLILSSLSYAKYIFSKGFVFAHLGVGLCILGASHAEIFTTKQEFDLDKLPMTFSSYTVGYVSHNTVASPHVFKEIFMISVNEKFLQSEIQYFHASRIAKHQTALKRLGLDDIHATIFKDDKNVKIELIHKPLINLLWIGIVVVLLGIAVSVKNRDPLHLSRRCGKSIFQALNNKLIKFFNA